MNTYLSAVHLYEGNQSPGIVSQQLESPRSYTVDTPTGQVRRNRRHLRHRTENM